MPNTDPPLPEWQFTKHALIRAVDMAVDADDIKLCLHEPQVVTTVDAYPDCVLYLRERLALAVNEEDRIVITVLWNKRHLGRSWSRDEIELSIDPEVSW